MGVQNKMSEKIATAAALALQKRFIEVAGTRTVLYVKNDSVWSKAPNSAPVLIKKLSGRNPELEKGLLLEGLIKSKTVVLILSKINLPSN